MRNIFFFLFLVLFIPCVSIGQPSRLHGQQSDERTQIGGHDEHLLEVIEQQRLDSLRRKELEDRLLRTKMESERERGDLLKELQLLKSRDSILMERRKHKVDSLRGLNIGVPVVPFRDTLFTLYNQVGSYTVEERVQTIERRIRQLAEKLEFKPDSIMIMEDENGWLIGWKDEMIISANDLDAVWAGMSAEELAKFYAKQIANSIVQHREDTGIQRILKGIAFALLIIVVAGVIIYAIGRCIRWMKNNLLSMRNTLFQGVRFRGAELISVPRQLKVVWLLLDTFKWILILLAIYFTLPMLLNQFPSTEGYAPVLIDYFLKPVKKICWAILDYLPNLATIIVVFFFFRYFLRALRFLAMEIEKGVLSIPGFYKDWAMPTYQILRVLSLAFMLIVIFPYFPGADTPIFKGVSVFLGVMVTFSSAGALGNIIAGLMITYMRSYSIGDRIKIGEVSGDIIEKNLLVTRIRTIKNEIISIPNAKVLNSHTLNYSADVEKYPLILYTNITIAYEVRWQKVHELAKKACARVKYLEKEPAPFVLQESLNDFYVTYQLNVYTREPHKQAIIYSELHKHILDVFHEAGVELLSPHYTSVRDGSAVDLPYDKEDDRKYVSPIRVEWFGPQRK